MTEEHLCDVWIVWADGAHELKLGSFYDAAHAADFVTENKRLAERNPHLAKLLTKLHVEQTREPIEAQHPNHHETLRARATSRPTS